MIIFGSLKAARREGFSLIDDYPTRIGPVEYHRVELDTATIPKRVDSCALNHKAMALALHVEIDCGCVTAPALARW